MDYLLGPPLVEDEARVAALAATVSGWLETGAKNRGKVSARLLLAAYRVLAAYGLETGDLDGAARHARKGLIIAEHEFGELSVELAQLLVIFGGVQCQQGSRAEGEQSLKDAKFVLAAVAESNEPWQTERRGNGLRSQALRLLEQLEKQNSLLVSSKRGGVLGVRRENVVGSVSASTRPRSGLLTLERCDSGQSHQDTLAAPPQTLANAVVSGKGAVSWMKIPGRSAGVSISSANNIGVPSNAGFRRRLRSRMSLMFANTKPSDEFAFSLEDLGIELQDIESSEDSAYVNPDDIITSISVVSIIDGIISLLSRAGREDHVELMLRAMLDGAYGRLSKLEEQRVQLRLACVLVGQVTESTGMLDEAISLLRRCLRLSKALFGKNDVQVAVTYADLGALHALKGSLVKAEVLCTKGVDLLRKHHLPQSMKALAISNLLAVKATRGLQAVPTDGDKKQFITSATPLLDHVFVLEQSGSSVCPEDLADVLHAALWLENEEKSSPRWFNWTGDSRKKALLAYSLEVFRDLSCDWAESEDGHADLPALQNATDDLLVILEIHRRMGCSKTQHLVTGELGENEHGCVGYDNGDNGYEAEDGENDEVDSVPSLVSPTRFVQTCSRSKRHSSIVSIKKNTATKNKLRRWLSFT